MRIGVVSDTHNNLANVARIVEIFNGEDVDRVVHTGDITQAKTLEVFARLTCPLIGVYGNNDLERASLESASAEYGLELHDPPLQVSWRERVIQIIHDPLDRVAETHHDVLLHGHTHRRTEEHDGETLIFNPGECAGHMVGHNAVGVLDLETLTPRVLLF